MPSTWTQFIAVSLVVTSVAATGGFPPINSSPGACGLSPADASCAAVVQSCIDFFQSMPVGNSTLDPYSNEACVAAASCYPQNPDTFLVHLSCFLNPTNSNVPKSAAIPRVPDSIANKLLSQGQGYATLESYTTWYNGVVAAANPNVTPFIDPAFVKMSFDIILAWTGFCSTGQIPKSNLVDWFQWFSTVSGPATTCNLVPNCPLSFDPPTIDLTVVCANIPIALGNPFSVPPCVAAALNWQDGIDSFLQAITCRYNINFNANNAVPASNALPDLSVSLSDSSTTYTFQDFIDFTYAAVRSTRSRFPVFSLGLISERWEVIVEWTNFCGSSGVPEKNLSDFLKFSHTALTSVCPAARTCNTDPNASCAQLFNACASSATFDPYANRNCVLAATCYQGGLLSFGSGLTCADKALSVGPVPQFWPRLTEAVFDTIGNNNTGVISQQNYIDAFYGALSQLSSPILPDVNYVIGKWSIIATWTQFSNGDVPYRNFADWLQFFL